MNSLKSITALAAAALLCMPAFAEDKMSNDDQAAMKQLAQDNVNEIAAGKMAADKAQSPDVKKFAQKMVDDHGKMLQDLKTLAKKKDVNLPESTSVKDMAQGKLMERKSGAEFDKEFMDHMVKDHEKALQEVKNVAAKAKDSEFKAAAQQAAGKIQEHLQLAQRLSKSAAAGSSSSK
jgi:putative membrane protein